MTAGDPEGVDPPPGGEFREFARRLTVDVVPAPDSSIWDLLSFGLSFDAYAYWTDHAPAGKAFSTSGNVGNKVAEQWDRHGDLPDDLVALRTALFFEQRRWRHLDERPDPETERYVRALVDAIRPHAVPV